MKGENVFVSFSLYRFNEFCASLMRKKRDEWKVNKFFVFRTCPPARLLSETLGGLFRQKRFMKGNCEDVEWGRKRFSFSRIQSTCRNAYSPLRTFSFPLNYREQVSIYGKYFFFFRSQTPFISSEMELNFVSEASTCSPHVRRRLEIVGLKENAEWVRREDGK